MKFLLPQAFLNDTSTAPTGVIVRDDLSLVAWADGTGIEVCLTGRQALELAEILIRASRQKMDRENPICPN